MNGVSGTEGSDADSDSDAQTVEWRIPPLDPDESVTITVNFSVDSSVPEALDVNNDATVAAEAPLGDPFDPSALKDQIRRSRIPDGLLMNAKHMIPTLVNSYVRSYFLSGDGRFRITIDTDLKWGRMNNIGSGNIRRYRDGMP